MLKSIAIYSLLLTLPYTATAIVNMDSIHFDNKKDQFTAAIDIKVSGSTGNSNTSKTSINSQLTWIADKKINLIILGYQQGSNNDVRTVNKSFIHYRYIYQINQQFDWEFFTQLETNEFTRLSYRGLMGTGARYSIAKSETHHAYLGFGGFYSKEKIETKSGLTDDGVNEFYRANFYLLSKYKVNKTIGLSNVLYYQPRLNKFSDYRALLETKLDFKINQELSFRLSFDITHDSEPSQTIEKTDISYMTGLIYKF